MAYYRNLREYLATLEGEGKLIRISAPINKDTELHPMVRLQFRGLPEEERRAFFFENVRDSKGRQFSIPVVVGCIAASRSIYAIGMQCSPEEISRKWTAAQANPIPPSLVPHGPVQENVFYRGEKGEGLGLLPVPISTPGFDNAPYITASNWVTKDPETGIRNVGTYRGQIKAPWRIGCFPETALQHVRAHWLKCKERGIPLAAALVVGVTPNISFASVAKIPYGVDELAVAGGIAGEPIELVQCKTIDLQVPAHAEIIIEGEIPTDELEYDAPFGEFTGYMGNKEMTLFMNVKCITCRKDPVYESFISQFPPSESSKIRQIAWENVILKLLKVDKGLNVLQVALHESSGSRGYCVISMKKDKSDDSWSALKAVEENVPLGKVVIIVDDDVDPYDPDAVNWALSFRMQPHRDMRIGKAEPNPLDHSLASPDERTNRDPTFSGELKASVLLIDATRKWSYPPISLPAKPYMEKALALWQQLCLPKLTTLHKPWFGYSLGYWDEELEKESELAVQGDYYITGEKFAAQRRKI